MTITMGTAKPMAQGQDTISTVMAYVTARMVAPWPLWLHRDSHGDPDDESNDCQSDDDRNKVRCHLIGKLLDLRFGKLCFVHH